MNLDEMIEREVGRERYEEACRWAWRTAAGTGTMDERHEWPDDLDDVPRELSDAIWEREPGERAERLATLFALYRAMPCYALLAPLVSEAYADETVNAELRVLLESPSDELADPAAYYLWVELFEAGDLTAWRAVTVLDGEYERRIERVLDASGPVAFGEKVQLYERLVGDARWHPWIFRSLLHSAYDVCGDFKRRPARRWFERLVLPPDTPHIDLLREKL